MTNPSLFVGSVVRSSPDRLAYWYFRLNGFLTIENFAVHDELSENTRTDADVIAVRFLDRRENYLRPMQDDERLCDCLTFANVIIAEVKTGRCALNGPWTKPERENMQRVLRAIGCVSPDEIEMAAERLYETSSWQSQQVTIRLVAMGERQSTDESMMGVPQFTWDEVIDFCIGRFRAYGPQKRQVSQWMPDGLLFRELCDRQDRRAIRRLFGLSPSS